MMMGGMINKVPSSKCHYLFTYVHFLQPISITHNGQTMSIDVSTLNNTYSQIIFKWIGEAAALFSKWYVPLPPVMYHQKN